jgi:nicotinamidase-related amidase
MQTFKTLIIMVALTQTVFSQDIEREKSAILLIEFQKTFTEKGIFHLFIKKQYESRKVLDNTKNLLSVARQYGLTIIQAPLILDKTDKYRYKKAPFPARLFKRFEKGTWKAEFAEGVYNKTDNVIQGRSSADACIDSDLLKQLNERNLKLLYVCGFITNGCVKETMNSLIQKGFECVLISDCTATTSDKLQQKTEKEFTVITSKQLEEKIKNASR